ncbi:low affinity immunoglobulin gamma Fc region receptor II-like isoform X3 [Oreochromis aureus]|uniref:low affinity immunoglobulin gamma Fc region receptor II-like isoform X3 n=1 Tax=Oreochromis aureus TaxID=47969 RepID=UPI001952E4CA|nr:low affinity immunoglobulin gamma Fc region receptor II-like isoform X3 [Oreochromis aureus]
MLKYIYLQVGTSPRCCYTSVYSAVFTLQIDNMDVRALCIRLLMTIMILLGVQGQKVDAVSLRVVPNRLQFFEYESVTFYCEGVDYCEVVQKFKGKIKSCNRTNVKTPTGSSCKMKTLYTDDSGEYWYDTEGGIRSNIINICVTNGPVILESPAVPVLIEETVTLSCRNKTISSNFTADFYKDGGHIHRSSTGNMTIHRVSKSNEGLYKCNISGAGESPESWLNITDSQNVNSTTNPDSHKEAGPSSSAATPWITATILFIFLLIVTMGLYHFSKEASRVNAGRATCAAVRKNRKKKENSPALSSTPVYYSFVPSDAQPQDGLSSRPIYSLAQGDTQPQNEDELSSRSIYYSLAQGDTQPQESEPTKKILSPGINQPIPENLFYSPIQMVAE